MPATTIDRQCGSSQQSAHFAAQGVIAGAYDIVVAAGVEVMSTTPMGASVTPGSFPMGPKVMERYAPRGGVVMQGTSAELIADKWDISREDMDAFAVESHKRAAAATDEGRFDNEIIAVKPRSASTARPARSSRPTRWSPPTRASAPTPPWSRWPSSSRPSTPRTARSPPANSSQITDGASAILIMSEEKAKELGLKPRAKFHSFAVAGVDPIMMLTGPIPATKKVLEKSGLTLDQMDLIEINEAFASVVLAWEKEYNPDMSKVNVNGGAIALGHPLGCSGAKLMATLLNELERTGGRYGLQTMCEGAGMANATIIERLD